MSLECPWTSWLFLFLAETWDPDFCVVVYPNFQGASPLWSSFQSSWVLFIIWRQMLARQQNVERKFIKKREFLFFLNYILIDGLWLCGIIYIYILSWYNVLDLGVSQVQLRHWQLSKMCQTCGKNWKKKVVWLYYVHPLSNTVEL
jgi:hypothetical protein